ncbi:citrate lyase holo-[acyl-carrier protein] synthase [Lactobacillus sp. DCY120]|uniref:citrate lyase holo-[acyl-carrier protein] synthase n=1 Tax=Bombilactobacillus apium TaxID=2675299 RepID=A0A850QWP3_9LACO|nr:citrate lyase holo-[acyl-carrier protein] synthase [Bombilactobacillus apium]NVY96224.1 citrate lyase holo-[acyl-carrier protein] synthase [Bombilactobacillus apium]
MADIFQTGISQDIAAVLQQKDQRVARQQQLLSENPQATLLDLKLNIPGPIKNNAALRDLFQRGIERLKAQFPGTWTVKTAWDQPTGNELMVLTDLDLVTAKQAAIRFEDQDFWGRLFDVDLLQEGDPQTISRTQLGQPLRQCLICSRPAKECARSRRHSVADLQAVISRLYHQGIEKE